LLERLSALLGFSEAEANAILSSSLGVKAHHAKPSDQNEDMT
jgi:hypothetical protein